MMKMAVVLIDMQKLFLRPLPKKTLKKILKANVAVIEELCLKGGYPLMVVEYAGCGRTVRTLGEKIKKVPPRRRKLFLKDTWSAFENEQFASYLLETNTDTLLLMGVYADRCVKETGEWAVAAGYKIITASSLMAGTESDYGRSAKWYKKNGIFYKDETSLLEDLIG